MSRRTGLAHRLLIVMAAALAAQGLWLALPEPARRMESGDFLAFYGPAARHLASGEGPLDDGGVLVTRYPPGYALLLAPIVRLASAAHLDEEAAIRWFQIACAGFGGTLLYGLARHVWSPRGALLVGLLFVLYPPVLWLARYPSSELPYVLPYFGSLHLLLGAMRGDAAGGSDRGRAIRLFGAGALAGIAALIRPFGAGVGFLLAAFAWLGPGNARTGSGDVSPSRRAAMAALVVAGVFTAWLPWEVFVWQRTGQVIPLSTGGPLSLLDGWTYAVNPDKPMASAPPAEHVVRLMQAIRESRSEFASLRKGAGVILRESRARPAAALELLAIKSARAWYGTDSGRFEATTRPLQAIVGAGAFAAAILAWRRGGRFRPAVAAISLLLALSWGMSIAFLSIARYLVPSLALTFVLLPHLLPARFRPDTAAGQSIEEAPSAPIV